MRRMARASRVVATGEDDHHRRRRHHRPLTGDAQAPQGEGALRGEEGRRARKRYP